MAVFTSFGRRLVVSSLLPFFCISALAAENFDATFGSSPSPFEINVHPEFINETVKKVSLTRYAVDVELPDLEDGPPRHNASTVRDYWINNYDWFDVQDRLNRRYNHFTISVLTGPRSNFSSPVPLHFVHHRSNRTNAIPLLFIHGFPGSFMEVNNILDPLLNPPNPSSPAFHVVAPSLPGYAFSPAPEKPGFGGREMGFAIHALMQQLNYTQYVIQAGDLGAIVSNFMAVDNPDSVISILNNLWIVQPNATDLQRYSQGLTSADENTTIEITNRYDYELSGYRLIQETKPLQLAIGMTDSPIGFAMWIYQLMIESVDRYVWTPEEIISWSMMYYIQGPYGGFRLYKELLREGVLSGFVFGNGIPYVHQPVAISEFPRDVWFSTPLDWARRRGNVVVRNVHDTGGHFASTESPALLLADMWAFWGNESLSNTGVFRR